MKGRRLLVHTCCGPCLLAPLEALSAEGYELTAYFYNPNIHPLIEFRRRLKALKVLQESVSIQVVCDEDYGLETWLASVDWRSHDRCKQCYLLRLRKTASWASDHGFDAFTTSMLVSPRQRHEWLKDAGETVAAEAKLVFVYRDIRLLHARTREMARAKSLYLQTYCGCIFSEYERYKDTTLHLYRGDRGREK